MICSLLLLVGFSLLLYWKIMICRTQRQYKSKEKPTRSNKLQIWSKSCFINIGYSKPMSNQLERKKERGLLNAESKKTGVTRELQPSRERIQNQWAASQRGK